MDVPVKKHEVAQKPKPAPVEIQPGDYVSEENRLYSQLEDTRFEYLVCDAKKDKSATEEHRTLRQAYEKALCELIVHRCTYALTEEGSTIESQTMGEHLLEIIASVINHDKDRRTHLHSQLRDDNRMHKIVQFIERRPKLKFSITMTLGTLAIVGTPKLGILPDTGETVVEAIGIAADSIGAALGTFVGVRSLRRRKHDKLTRQRLDQQEDAMLDDAQATLRFFELLGDYLSHPHQQYFRDKALSAHGKAELAKVIDELEEAIERHATHLDVKDLAGLVKRYFKEILSDGGLLQQLENSPSDSEAHTQVVLKILDQELDDQEREWDDPLFRKIEIIGAATIGAATAVGGFSAGYHKIDMPETPEDEGDN